MKNHVKVKIDVILNNSLFKITMIVLCCLILSTSIIINDIPPIRKYFQQ